MQIRLSRDLEERFGSARAPMTVDEFFGRFRTCRATFPTSPS